MTRGAYKAPGWELRLVEFVRETRDRPFVWGEWDCVQFALASIDAMAGCPVPRPHPRYRTRAQAVAVNRRHKLADWMQSDLAAYPVPLAFLTVGDFALYDDDGVTCAMLILGDGFTAPVPDEPTQTNPLAHLRVDGLFLRFD